MKLVWDFRQVSSCCLILSVQKVRWARCSTELVVTECSCLGSQV